MQLLLRRARFNRTDNLRVTVEGILIDQQGDKNLLKFQMFENS